MKFLISVPYARTIPVLRMKCKKGTQTANVQSSGGSLFNELMLALLQLIQPNHYTVLEPNHVIYVHLALNSAFSNFAATKMNISCSGQLNLLYSNAQRKKLLDAEQLCLADSMHIAIPHNINTTQHIVGLFAAKFGNWEDDRQQGSDVSILPIYAICIKHFLWRSPSLSHGIRMEYTKHNTHSMYDYSVSKFDGPSTNHLLNQISSQLLWRGIIPWREHFERYAKYML